jgi:hypothetical protein
LDNLELIDWRMVAFASLWIIGLAFLITAISFAYYNAQVRGGRLREELRISGYQVAINGGLALFSTGLLGSASTWWERSAWGLLVLAFIYYTFTSWRGRRAQGPAPRDLVD